MSLLPKLPLFLLATACSAELRLNQFQAVGSHNSYHLAPPVELLELLRKSNKETEAWNYTHPPLAVQLDAGLRQFELDVFADARGGLFADPLGVRLAALRGSKLPPFDPAGDLKKPGFKVLHVPDLDCWSNTPTLAGALADLLAWSDRHPRHLPLMVLVECKDQAHPTLPTRPEPFTRARLLELEQAILSIVPASRTLRPDEVRAGEPTLRDAVRKHGWPGLDSLRGKFLFCLDNTDAIRDRYLDGNSALQDRLLFASAPDDEHPAAGWFKCNDPVRDFERIRGLVKAGFLVRTRADTRRADPRMREKAFESGAHWISTDHFGAPDPVAFAGGKTFRPNPLTAAEAEPASPLEP